MTREKAKTKVAPNTHGASTSEVARAVGTGSEGSPIDTQIMADEFHPECLQWLEDCGAGFLIDDYEPARAIDLYQDLDYWTQQWISAIEDMDERQDYCALVSLIFGSVPVPSPAERHILDFFKRICLKLAPKGARGKGGRPPKPSYISPALKESRLDEAIAELRGGKKEDWDEKVNTIADKYGFTPTELKQAFRGTLPWYKRAKERRARKRAKERRARTDD
jgi:hypothetical protein